MLIAEVVWKPSKAPKFRFKTPDRYFSTYWLKALVCLIMRNCGCEEMCL